mgnify:FL=1
MFKFNIYKKEIELLCELLEKNNLTEIEIKNGNKSIKLSKNSYKNTIISATQENISNKKENKTDNASQGTTLNLENTVKAPMLGTLYHSPSPNAKPFIKVGSKVKSGDVIFIIEAMKTMNQVKSDKTGIVKKILVENAMPVEFDQDLIVVE